MGLIFAQRVATSVVLIGATVFILFGLPPAYFGAQVAFFTMLGLGEFFSLMRKGNSPVYRVFGIAMGTFIPILVTIEMGLLESGDILFLVLGCLFLFVLQFFRKDNSQALTGISLTLFGILYVSWFLSFLIKVRFLPGGAWWVAYLLAVTKSSDIGAYLVGTLAGRHSLIPHVSPKKSIEGTIGGLAASLCASLAFGPYLPLHFTTTHLAVLGLLISVVGQIGDLSESLMKRSCQAKDSGSLLPGMGGVLDAVDSVLFTAPIFYFHLQLYL
ncbi:MAG: phosphatidate cytidylyltransferase [Candidatus Omnitrophica bacterium]|nr:phosphatidate cytidylyltransferase [Candidatus Omnitrophota bacterium]